jgi:hypothetical protein
MAILYLPLKYTHRMCTSDSLTVGFIRVFPTLLINMHITWRSNFVFSDADVPPNHPCSQGA